MHLIVHGHNAKQGFAISRVWNDAECSYLAGSMSETPDATPVRYFTSLSRANRFVARWNRLHARHQTSVPALNAALHAAIHTGYVTVFHVKRGRAVGATYRNGQLIVECNEQAYTLDYRF
ncbi:hypothetical protein [Paraburkholderia largidicola]|uniref:Uncharacterized protein n=1 Tax=Paraburkholderia largidicola TaxID=3014751 RepID=A0A7I8C2U0_9BURK|nr:hypothetical protein [Paraburkholderia sp. PGU16]BCF95396.1 hypothetical protein PPGU16_84630 [Paraburkholderia sp. PGU16]